MKKLILFLACSMLLVVQLRAQTAQDFSAIDIKGNNQNLYSKLNSGKIVILVFFSTDNKNSFSYHNGGFLPNLYASHGPSGDNQLEIFYIEGDSNTSDNCIFGASNCASSNNTTQDWTAGIDFPIISSPQLAQSYNVSSFPSIFYICPGKKYEKVPALTATSLWARASQCPLPAGDNNVGIYYFDSGLPYNEICGTTIIKPKFTIVNTGKNPISGLKVFVRLNDLVLDTIPIPGTLYHLDERVIVADDVVLQDTGTLTLYLTPLQNEAFLQDNSRSKSFTKAIKFMDRQIKVRIRTDSYGSETYWELKDLSNQQIVAYNGNTCVGPSGGGIYNPDCISSTTYGNDQQNTVSITLPYNGCYSFNIVDAVGDGMLQCGSNNPCGYYVYDSNTSNYQNAPIQGDDFMEGRQYQFEIDAPVDTHTPANEETIVNALKINPNPFSDQITIQYEASTQQNIRFTVYSSTGQLIYSEGSQSIETGLKTWQTNTFDWPSGVYFAVVQSQDNASIQTFVKQKN